MNKRLIILTLSLLAGFLVLAGGVAKAATFRADENATVAAGEVVDGMLFAAGKNVNINGLVRGDVYCAGETVIIGGEVEGDVICGAQQVSISGKVSGDGYKRWQERGQHNGLFAFRGRYYGDP